MSESEYGAAPAGSQELERLLATRSREISVLEHAARFSGAMAHLKEEDLCSRLSRQVTELLAVRGCVVLLYDPDRDLLAGQVPAVGLPDKVAAGYHLLLAEDSPVRRRLESAEGLIVNDLDSDPLVSAMQLDELVPQPGIGSTLLVGLWQDKELLGAIQVFDKQDGTGFDAGDARVLSILAGQAALTIQNMRLLKQSQRHIEEMASLYEMASIMAQATELDEMLDTVLKQVGRVLEYDACLIFLDTADGSALRIEAVDGEGLERMLGVEFSIEQGINAWIYREGKPMLVDDANLEPRRLHIEGRTERIRAAVGAPLIVDGQPIGTIYATRYHPSSFTEAHLSFLTITAAQVAGAVQRARLLDRSRRRAEELETLLAIAAAIASRLDVDHILEAIRTQASRIMDTAAFFVALYDQDTDALRFDLVYDRDERVEPFVVRFSESQSLTAYVVRSAQPLLIRNWELEGGQFPIEPLLVGEPTLSWLGVPIIVQDQVLGVIGAQSYEPYAFRARHLSLLVAIANQAGISLQNARLVAELRLVNTDLREMVSAQAHLLRAIDEMNSASGLEPEEQDLRRATGKG